PQTPLSSVQVNKYIPFCKPKISVCGSLASENVMPGSTVDQVPIPLPGVSALSCAEPLPQTAISFPAIAVSKFSITKTTTSSAENSPQPVLLSVQVKTYS